jgi:NAD(P)-dependent dehydrogenase (short-subunit alcohol dehydrogenase family)
MHDNVQQSRPDDPAVAVRRKRAVITGSNGGLGRALARAFGETMDLVLTDMAGSQLEDFERELLDGGYVVAATIPGDLCDASVVAKIVAAAAAGAGLGVLVHTAALAPTGAAWDRIMTVNLVATEELLQAVAPVLMRGSVVLVISSNAGYFAVVDRELSEIIADPLHPQLLSRLAPHVDRLSASSDAMDRSSTAYMLSKWGVTELCARRAPEWTRRGARLVTISPGVINTPMGRAERERNPRAAMFIDCVPAGRMATAMDIVATARFLASDGGSYISGCDIRVDGAAVPALQAMLATHRI